MVRRCVLLAPGQAGVDLLLLPPGVLPRDVLELEQRHQASLAGGTQLHWRHHAALAGRHNLLASALAQTQVHGDAVLVAQGDSEAQLRQAVEDLAARHLQGGMQWRWDSVAAGVADGAGDLHAAERQRRRLRHQQATMQRLLRRPAGTPPPAPEPPAAGGAAAPATPAVQRAAGSAVAPTPAERDAAPQALHSRARPAASPPSQQHEVPVYKCEPRQALLWTIAGRATSLSWQTSVPGAAAAPVAATSLPASSGTTAAPAADTSNVVAAAVAAAERSAAAAEGDAALPAAPELVALPAKSRSSQDRSPWADLQPEMLAAVLQQSGHSSELARALSQVCGSWRRGLAEERAALARLRFTRLEHTAGSGAAAPVQLPWLVHQAVKAGNVAATVAAARWLDRQPGRPQRPVCPRTAAATAYAAGTWYRGCEAAVAAVASASATAVPRGGDADAARYWSRGAKMGHPEAQWRLGFAHYKGLMGLAHDGEEAHLWLSRAARQLCELLGVSLDQPSAAAGAEGSTRALPALLSAADCRAILAQAAHILGYLYLDGEGTRVDVGAALRWFRLAEHHGCLEAARIVGSLLNTGQYG